MALERNPNTCKNAVRLLQGAGRGVISDHGAQMAVNLLENNGFQIWEIMPDPPVEPTPAPEPEPEYGTIDSLKIKEGRVRKLRDELQDTELRFVQEMNEAMHKFYPVFEAIRMAMEATSKEVPQDGGAEG